MQSDRKLKVEKNIELKGEHTMKRRIVALLLVLVLTFSFSSTVFAAPVGQDGKIPIDVIVDGPTYRSMTVRLDPTTSLYDDQDVTIENNGYATAFDALIASGLMDNYFAVEYLDTTTWQGTGIYGIAFDEFDGQPGYDEPYGNQTKYYYWDVEIKEAANGSYQHVENYATH